MTMLDRFVVLLQTDTGKYIRIKSQAACQRETNKKNTVKWGIKKTIYYNDRTVVYIKLI